MVIPTTNQPDLRDINLPIAVWGERKLLAHLQQFSPAAITGDDGAVLTLPNSDPVVISTDMLVENVHFSDQTTTAFDVGWRAAAANLSDLAAMGATPTGITVALGLPPTTPVSWVGELYQGLTACLKPWRSPILGGDLCSAPVRTISITIFGQVKPGKAIYRSQARLGDWILATGDHGCARAGLECLGNKARTNNLGSPQRQLWQRAHQRPWPRLDLLPPLQALDVPIAGMDSSDGLADAVLQICRASGVGAEIWQEKLPLPPALVDWVGLETAIAWTLYGGEDFELVLTLPAAVGEQWLEKVDGLDFPPGRRPQLIGKIIAGADVFLISADGDRKEILSDQGFQHF